MGELFYTSFNCFKVLSVKWFSEELEITSTYPVTISCGDYFSIMEPGDRGLRIGIHTTLKGEMFTVLFLLDCGLLYKCGGGAIDLSTNEIFVKF